jgi:DNA-binding MarR family transcriptional regulator
VQLDADRASPREPKFNRTLGIRGQGSDFRTRLFQVRVAADDAFPLPALDRQRVMLPIVLLSISRRVALSHGGSQAIQLFQTGCAVFGRVTLCLVCRMPRVATKNYLLKQCVTLFIGLDVHCMNALGACVAGMGAMAGSLPTDENSGDRIVLGLLNSVEADGARSQRRIAAELGVALGLVNAYLKRAVKKGLVKVGQAPARRYAYYLTPQGFSEKSRLTIEYLSSSFSLFRKAKEDYGRIFDRAYALGYEKIVLAGKSDFCEIAILCAVDSPISIVAVVDPDETTPRFIGVKVVPSYEAVGEPFDAVVVTHLTHAKSAFDQAIAMFGAERVLAPNLLGLTSSESKGTI